MTKKETLFGLIVFSLLFVLIAGFYYDSVLDKGPLNTHMWRQTDCLSMTQNYSEGGAFLMTEMHCQLADNYTSGYSIGEFPLFYYTVGNIWKWFGKSFSSYRIFYLIILFSGILAFFRSLQLIFRQNYWSITLSILLFTSPVFAVYGVGFLSDAPAFSCILIAIYFFIMYQIRKKNWFFYLCLVFFLIGGLSKISMMIAFIVLGIVLLLETVTKIKTLGNRQLFQEKWHVWIGFTMVIIGLVSWYAYAEHFNDIHRFKYTFNHTWPIWKMGADEIDLWIEGIKNITGPVFFSKPMLLFLVLGGIYNLFSWKTLPLFAFAVNALVILGCTLYFILWGPLMRNHDYYYIALVILYVGIIPVFLWNLKNKQLRIFNHSITKVTFGLFVLFNVLYCFEVVKLKTLKQEGKSYFVSNKDFTGLMKWNNWDNSLIRSRYEGMKNYMKEIGVAKEDLILSMPDPSFNISLYLLDHKGWTNFQGYTTSEQIETLREAGAKYLIVSDSAVLEQSFLHFYIQEPMGEFQGIQIFKL